MIESAYVPHREQLGSQIPWLAKSGFKPNAGEGLMEFLRRLDTEEVITLVSRKASEDAYTLRGAMSQAEKSGRLFVVEPRASLAPRRVTLADVPGEKHAYTLTRSESQDPRRYAAAKKASIEAGAGPIPNIISG